MIRLILLGLLSAAFFSATFILNRSIFYKARNESTSPYVISAVDATQSGEVIFSLAGEILLLNGAMPNLTGGIGMIIIVVGIVGYTLRTA